MKQYRFRFNDRVVDIWWTSPVSIQNYNPELPEGSILVYAENYKGFVATFTNLMGIDIELVGYVQVVDQKFPIGSDLANDLKV